MIVVDETCSNCELQLNRIKDTYSEDNYNNNDSPKLVLTRDKNLNKQQFQEDSI